MNWDDRYTNKVNDRYSIHTSRNTKLVPPKNYGYGGNILISFIQLMVEWLILIFIIYQFILKK